MNPAEERRLAQIRRQLAADDPGLVRQLTTGRRSASSETAGTLGTCLTAVAGGLFLLALGIQLASPVLVTGGALLMVAVPTLHTVWQHRRERVRWMKESRR